MSLLTVSIAADTLAAVVEGAEKASQGGAEAVELRIDAFADDPRALAEHLRTHPDRTWIVACRGVAEGGRCRADARTRAARAAAAAGAHAYVDFELADWSREPAVRETLARVAAGGRLILSSHHFDGPPDRPRDLVQGMLEAEEAAVAKVAYQARTISDSFAALDMMHEHGGSVIAVAMGEAGLWTRVLAAKLGGFCTYCAPASESATAPGQLSLADMLERYRWRAIDRDTKVYGVLGDPVGHSMSPRLFNRWFHCAGADAVYLPLHVPAEELEGFLEACRRRPWLDLGGFSVTIPHKARAFAWVGGGADWLSRGVEAVNTLSLDAGGPRGYNTDCHAAVSSLVEALGGAGGPGADLFGRSIDVLGTGGAARAVVAGLREYGAAVTVYGRSPEKGRSLADRFQCDAEPWERRAAGRGEVLVNCTNVGMWPRLDESPMPPEGLECRHLVFDLIYNPLETSLLRQASAVGARTLNGLDMFLRQAAAQFELWTSMTPDRALGRSVIAEALEDRPGTP